MAGAAGVSRCVGWRRRAVMGEPGSAAQASSCSTAFSRERSWRTSGLRFAGGAASTRSRERFVGGRMILLLFALTRVAKECVEIKQGRVVLRDLKRHHGAAADTSTICKCGAYSTKVTMRTRSNDLLQLCNESAIL